MTWARLSICARMGVLTRRRRFFAVTGSPGGMTETWRRLMDNEPSGFVSLAFEVVVVVGVCIALLWCFGMGYSRFCGVA